MDFADPPSSCLPFPTQPTNPPPLTEYYGIAAAVGKIGAFVGTWVFPYIIAAGGNETQSAQYPFYVSSCLCLLSAVLAYMLPHIGQDTITVEDARFRAYLESKGWDTRQLGLKKGESVESVAEQARGKETEAGGKEVDG